MKEETKTDNELIAEFMGIEVHRYTHWSGVEMLLVPNPNGILDWPAINQFCPDKDWNILMPVVEKIRGLVHFGDLDAVDRKRMFNTSIFTTLPDVYRRVVDFIKWYNQNKQQS